MHVLTKIFIVLVALLAVLLVPLVVVYAHNESSYKSRLQTAELKAAAAQEALKLAETRAGAELAQANNRASELDAQARALGNDKAAAEATIRQLESELALTKDVQVDIQGRLAMLSETMKAGQNLTESLVNELRDLRTTAVAIERQKVELDEALRDVTVKLEVAEQARRALSEELARVKDDRAAAMDKLSQYHARVGDLDDSRVSLGGLTPDKNVTATIIRVIRNNDEVLAEIDAGQRDGVKKDWRMTIADGGDFVANLQIINVDVNRATGKVTLEDPKTRGKVEVGQTAVAVAGRD